MLEERLKEYENRLEEMQKKTDDSQNEKLVQVNKKLKRALQTVKDQILGATRNQPDLFDGISEDTNERLTNLIATLGNRSTQIDALHAERHQIEEQLRNENKELQR